MGKTICQFSEAVRLGTLQVFGSLISGPNSPTSINTKSRGVVWWPFRMSKQTEFPRRHCAALPLSYLYLLQNAAHSTSWEGWPVCISKLLHSPKSSVHG
jgi:hypothetical protein